MQVICPTCEKSFRVKAEHEGRSVLCPDCRTRIPIATDLPDEPAPRPAPSDDPLDFGPPIQERKKPARRRRADDEDDEEDEEDSRPRYQAPYEKEEDLSGWILFPVMFPFIALIVGPSVVRAGIIPTMIGGVIGGLAMAVNGAVARKRETAVGVKLAVCLVTTVLAVGAFFAVMAVLLKALGR